MRLVRYLHNGAVACGVLDSDDAIRNVFGGHAPEPDFSGITVPLASVKLLPPIAPSKIIALGLNYREHIRELGMEEPKTPVIFLKPPSAVIGPGDAIELPENVGRVDYEAELALVVGRRCRRLQNREAHQALLGITCFNDVTARDAQRTDGQWTRSKSFDTFAPMGPWIETDGPLEDRRVECFVNGARRQSADTADLLFGLRELLVFISGIMTLEPGDVIASGTPSGVGPLRGGDTVEVRISGIGSLINTVASSRDQHDPQNQPGENRT